MDIRIDKAAPSQQPAEGWHQFSDGRVGHVTAQGDHYALQIFAPKQVTADNFDVLEERAKRLAWACFAEMGAPGPSAPKPPAPKNS